MSMIFRNPQALLLLLALPLFVGLWRLRRGRVASTALWLRLVAVTLVVVALAEPIFAREVAQQGTLVILVDQSDSLGEEGKASLRDQAQAMLQSNEGSGYNALHVLYFGKNRVASAATQDVSAQLGANGTDLSGALRAAQGLILPGTGRVVLLSDGGQTQGDVLAEVAQFQRHSIPVDTLAYTPPEQPDVWVASVDMPPTLREGEEFIAKVEVWSLGTASGELRLSDGEDELASQAVELVPGQNSFEFPSRANQPGVLRLQATVVVQPDSQERNNSAAATALVAPPPRVLLVEGRGGSAPLRVGLREERIDTSVIQAGELPSQLSQLDGFDAVVLVDVPAGDMTLDQMTTLREFVRSEGRGLIVAGGRSSYTLGAYKGTPLEEALPVQMDPPPRPQRADVSLLLIVDRSASMGPEFGPSKFNMAKEAALLATESLRDEDRLGVLTFDTGNEWSVAFQQIGSGLSLAEIQERIGSIQMGGGTDILAALEEGLPALATQPGKVRHAVLLTDGRSFTNELGEYRRLLELARSQNITLSAIAIGEDSDTQLMQNLADWGAGRYHFAAEPEDIPRLTMLESEIARAEPQVEGEFRANQTALHPLLRDFPANRIPSLEGYVATTLKPEAELVLESPEKDPVLSVWQYGLGRAVAWTPSIESPWAPNWSNWPEYGQFWAQIIRYTLPEPDSGLTQVRVTPRGDEAIITVDSLGPGGTTFDLADTSATITLPDGTTRDITLRQNAPGRYTESVKLPADGPYIVDVSQTKDDMRRAASTGYVQHYSAEYLPVRDGAALLQRVSQQTGGDVLAGVQPASSVEQQPRERALGFAPWLLLLAALLWPLEIAVRRGWLRRR